MTIITIMNIAILSRSPQLYSTKALIRAATRKGHQVTVFDHTKCQLVFERGMTELFYLGRRIKKFDAIIPRIGASVTEQGAAVIAGFELQDVFTPVRSEALLLTRNKLKSLLKLARCGVAIPKTAYLPTTNDLLYQIEKLGGFPIVVKLQEGTHGVGVVLVDGYKQAISTVEAFQKLGGNVILQEFIREARGEDVRAIVIGGKIVAIMQRTAKSGDFRSNLHRGASAIAVELTAAEERIVLDAARVMGLEVAGVDFIRSERGPLVLEVNASPGLEGIEQTTKIKVGEAIISFVENRVNDLHVYRSQFKQYKAQRL